MSSNVERNPEYEAAFKRMRRRRAVWRGMRRGGCLLGVLVWLVILLAVPYVFVTLMVEKEIIISHSDVPGHQIRVFFLDDIDQRGFGLQRARITQGGPDEQRACVATSVDYLLWEGDIEPIDYRLYYERQDNRWVQLVAGNTDCLTTQFDFETPSDEG